MNVEVLTALIGTTGFPIVMCGILSWYILYREKNLVTAIDNNTKIMQQLYDRMNIS